VLIGSRVAGRDMQRRYMVSVAGLALMTLTPIATYLVVAPGSTKSHTSLESLAATDSAGAVEILAFDDLDAVERPLAHN
jgi:hypothetical protein